MNKIDFQNLPSTTTPVNATNLNALQDNVEDVFDGADPMGNIVVDSIRSKNMLDFNGFSTQTIEGITFTNNGDGSITINGTASQAFGVNFIQFKINAGNYYLSLNETGTSPSTFYLYDHDSYVGYGNGAITLSQDFTHMGFDTYIQSGDTFNNVVIRPQLETGSTATSYVPYQNLDNTGTLLFSGSLNSADIPLSDNVQNYNSIEITFGNAYGGFQITRFRVPGVLEVVLFKCELDTNGSGIVIPCAKYTLDNNYLRYNGSTRVYKYLNDANWTQDNNNPIAIVKVVGYK